MKKCCTNRVPNNAMIANPQKRALVALKQVISSLAEVPDEEWAFFSRRVCCLAFGDREYLIRAGEPVTDFYFIVNGLVRFFYQTEDDRGKK